MQALSQIHHQVQAALDALQITELFDLKFRVLLGNELAASTINIPKIVKDHPGEADRRAGKTDLNLP
ncbi:hypothetical protein [Desulfococcus sp.]|uniref:hypothetical protein n=1 Tax=Desulfococcus sp. TaxID=2025834 RepID=UPI0035945B56